MVLDILDPAWDFYELILFERVRTRLYNVHQHTTIWKNTNHVTRRV